MAPNIYLRDVANTINDIKSAPSTFSSWDNCMSKAYCKWPVIILIVSVSLILISIIWCLARCLCCGLSCCCGCCSCCGRRSRSGPRHADPPPTFGARQGYQPAPNPPAYEAGPPQFATFDAGNRKTAAGTPVHEDSLPAMPSWDTAQSKKVLEEHPAENEGMEMGKLDPTRTSPVHPGNHMSPLATGLTSPQPSPYGHNGASEMPSYPGASNPGYGFPAPIPSPGHAQPSPYTVNQQPTYGIAPAPTAYQSPSAQPYQSPAYSGHQQQQQSGYMPFSPAAVGQQAQPQGANADYYNSRSPPPQHAPGAQTPGRGGRLQDSWTVV